MSTPMLFLTRSITITSFLASTALPQNRARRSTPRTSVQLDVVEMEPRMRHMCMRSRGMSVMVFVKVHVFQPSGEIILSLLRVNNPRFLPALVLMKTCNFLHSSPPIPLLRQAYGTQGARERGATASLKWACSNDVQNRLRATISFLHPSFRRIPRRYLHPLLSS